VQWKINIKWCKTNVNINKCRTKEKKPIRKKPNKKSNKQPKYQNNNNNKPKTKKIVIKFKHRPILFIFKIQTWNLKLNSNIEKLNLLRFNTCTNKKGGGGDIYMWYINKYN
jgi:hypothetical protein